MEIKGPGWPAQSRAASAQMNQPEQLLLLPKKGPHSSFCDLQQPTTSWIRFLSAHLFLIDFSTLSLWGHHTDFCAPVVVCDGFVVGSLREPPVLR